MKQNPEELERYARQCVMPEIGEAGQERLAESRVLVVGAGGLGSPAAFYLAAAGVGTIGIADGDVVACSNLQRQILHTTERIGMPKTASAQKDAFCTESPCSCGYASVLSERAEHFVCDTVL